MKRYLSILLAFCMLLATLSVIAACTPQQDSAVEQTTQNDKNEETTTEKNDATTEDVTDGITTEATTSSDENTTEGETVTDAPPTTYTVTFVVDGEKYDEVTYVEGAESIEVPAPPVIDGMIVYWESFTLSNENITVNAIYYSGDLVYTPVNVNGEEMLSVTGYTGTATSIIVPVTHEGVAVYSIGENAFASNTAIVNVTVLGKITKIDEEAFLGCTALKSVILPDTLENIGVGVFMNCTALESVTLGSGLKKLGINAFRGCTALVKISLPESLIMIDQYAFEGCVNLEEIISRGVDQLSGNAFENCGKLTTTLHIHSYGEETVALEPTCGDKGILTKTCTSEECEHFVRNLDIKPTGNHSFGAAVETSSLTCTTNGEFTRTCEHCGQKSVEITYANGHYFGEWTVTTSATCAADGSMTRKCKYCGYDDVFEVSATGNHKFSNGTCSVCSTPENATAELQFTLINNDAEYSVSLEGGELQIDKVIIPAYYDGKPVTKINYIYCPSASVLYIPETITEIRKEAFYGMKKLTDVYYNAVNCKDIEKEGAFVGAGAEADGITLHVGAGVQSIPSYIFTSQASGTVKESFLLSVIFDEGSVCTSIGPSAFYKCAKLSYINLPDSVEFIGSYAFSGTASLTEFTVPKNLTGGSSYVFAGMTGLTTLYYNAVNFRPTMGDNDSGSSYGEYAMFSASGAESGITVYIGADVERIPATIFSAYNSDYLPKIKHVVFDKDSKCDRIGAHALRNLMLETIVVPTSLTTVFEGAFSYYDSYGSHENTKVFYYGDAGQWSAINVGGSNHMFNGTESEVYIYSETAPETEGNFWHMVYGVPVIW